MPGKPGTPVSASEREPVSPGLSALTCKMGTEPYLTLRRLAWPREHMAQNPRPAGSAGRGLSALSLDTMAGPGSA